MVGVAMSPLPARCQPRQKLTSPAIGHAGTAKRPAAPLMYQPMAGSAARDGVLDAAINAQTAPTPAIRVGLIFVLISMISLFHSDDTSDSETQARCGLVARKVKNRSAADYAEVAKLSR